MACAKCGGEIPRTRRADAQYCSLSCSTAAEKFRWRKRNPHKALAYQRQWQKDHPEKLKGYRKALWQMKKRKGLDPFSRAKAAGYRSGLEVAVAEQLKAAGIPVCYEELRIPFQQPTKARHFCPDFVLPNGIVIESKGRFVTADRQKHLMVKEQHPDIDIRFVFSNSKTRISKQSKTTYAAWATTKGFQYADRAIPLSWLKEPKNHRSIAAINFLRGQ